MAGGGAVWELSPRADVRLWSDKRPDPDLVQSFPIHKLDESLDVFPRGGTLVFIGVYDLPGNSMPRARPRRMAVVIYNTFCPTDLKQFHATCTHQRYSEVDGVRFGGAPPTPRSCAGIVEPSPIDLKRFRPTSHGNQNADFTIGRLSQQRSAKAPSEQPRVSGS